MPSKENKVIYTLEEDMWLTYLYKIDQDRIFLDNLLFDKTDLPLHIKSMLCEYFSLLYNLEEVLYKMADENNYDSEGACFVVSEALALKFSLYLKGLVVSQEIIADNNYSISLH